jgi:hypothetical protein
MTSAELTSETSQQVMPNNGVKFTFWTGTAVNNTDYVTLTDLTIVQGAVAFATDGTAGTISVGNATNVVTFSNGGTKTWKILAWGY